MNWNNSWSSDYIYSVLHRYCHQIYLNLPVHILHFRSKRWALCSDVVSLSIQVRISGIWLPRPGWMVLLLGAGAGTFLLCSWEAAYANTDTQAMTRNPNRRGARWTEYWPCKKGEIPSVWMKWTHRAFGSFARSSVGSRRIQTGQVDLHFFRLLQ